MRKNGNVTRNNGERSVTPNRRGFRERLITLNVPCSTRQNRRLEYEWLGSSSSRQWKVQKKTTLLRLYESAKGERSIRECWVSDETGLKMMAIIKYPSTGVEGVTKSRRKALKTERCVCPVGEVKTNGDGESTDQGKGVGGTR